MRAIVVVGAGYGDEGKGLMTDYFCHEAVAAGQRVLCVRSNGGTQAAHTVRTRDGQHHVFKTYGAGSFAGAATYFGPEFLLNPIGFKMEADTCPALTETLVYGAGSLAVSLPVDMMINQLMEERRGTERHGSCGWGIGETVERGLRSEWRISLDQLRTLTLDKLSAVSAEYAGWRLNKLGVDSADLSMEWRNRLTEEGVLLRFLADADYACQRITSVSPQDLHKYADTLVFEGAQGLGLDAEGEHFPHVTRSRTGSTNVLEILDMVGCMGQEAQVESLDMVYVTRCYATRHGAGPLEHEGDPHGCVVADPTNQPNKWQGTLRTAPVDLELTTERIKRDFVPVLRAHPEARLGIAMTCLDQAGSDYRYATTRRLPQTEDPCGLLGRITAKVRAELLDDYQLNNKGSLSIVSHGPTRGDVRVLFEDDSWISALKSNIVRTGRAYDRD